MSCILRSTLAIAGAALAFTIAAPSEAVLLTLIIDDAGSCNGTWVTNGSATNPTLTCSPVGTPQPPVVAPAPPTPVPPPIVPGGIDMCAGYTVVDMGNLGFTGIRLDTNGVRGGAVAVGTITIPTDPGFVGKSAMISVFENGNGTVWRHATLSRNRCDFAALPPAAAGNTGPNLYLSFGGSDPSMVPVNGGEVWYLNVKNEFWTPFNSHPTLSCGGVCDFGVKVYPPSY